MTRPIPTVCCIVEGDGEVQAVPVLVRRIAAEVLGAAVLVPRPHRLPRPKILTPSELARAAQLQADRAGEHGGVLVLTDADGDEVADLITRIGQGMDVRVVPRSEAVIAVQEYEAWFLASIASLRSHRSINDDAVFDGDPELPRGAKERLRRVMNEKYRERIHQPAFSHLINLDAAREGSPSFAVFVEAVTALVDRG